MVEKFPENRRQVCRTPYVVRQNHKKTIIPPSQNHILNHNFFPKPLSTLAIDVPRGTFRRKQKAHHDGGLFLKRCVDYAAFL